MCFNILANEMTVYLQVVALDIIVHDTWYNVWFVLLICHSSLMWNGIDMQGHIALHMHGDISFHGCGCRVEINHLTW